MCVSALQPIRGANIPEAQAKECQQQQQERRVRHHSHLSNSHLENTITAVKEA